MNNKKKNENLDWDERRLGADPKYVEVADESHEAALNEALGLTKPKTTVGQNTAPRANAQQTTQ